MLDIIEKIKYKASIIKNEFCLFLLSNNLSTKKDRKEKTIEKNTIVVKHSKINSKYDFCLKFMDNCSSAGLKGLIDKKNYKTKQDIYGSIDANF